MGGVARLVVVFVIEGRLPFELVSMSVDFERRCRSEVLVDVSCGVLVL